MELKQYLKTNCHWENRVIISPNELMAIYSKANYQPTPKLIDFLIYFYNQEFQFPKVDVHFNLKKTLNVTYSTTNFVNYSMFRIFVLLGNTNMDIWSCLLIVKTTYMA